MIIGIVGAEEAKFTEQGTTFAKSKILEYIIQPEVTEVCSGCCHLGGVDIWAEIITKEVGKKFTPFPPYGLFWQKFKERNIQIAKHSAKVYNITVNKLSDTFTGMRHDCCYHCEKNSVIPYPPHIKSGGCWTMWYAINIGKEGQMFVVKNIND